MGRLPWKDESTKRLDRLPLQLSVMIGVTGGGTNGHEEAP